MVCGTRIGDCSVCGDWFPLVGGGDDDICYHKYGDEECPGSWVSPVSGTKRDCNKEQLKFLETWDWKRKTNLEGNS